jgi:hypothetical protein
MKHELFSTETYCGLTQKEYSNYNCAIIHMYWLKENALFYDMEFFSG